MYFVDYLYSLTKTQGPLNFARRIQRMAFNVLIVLIKRNYPIALCYNKSVYCHIKSTRISAKAIISNSYIKRLQCVTNTLPKFVITLLCE